jgi:hypothetical protein
MTHTALTADEEIRRIRGLATARKESRMVGKDHLESRPRRGLAAEVTCRDILTSAPPRPMLVMRAQARLVILIRRLGRRPANPIKRHHWSSVLRDRLLDRQLSPLPLRDEFGIGVTATNRFAQSSAGPARTPDVLTAEIGDRS